MDQRDRAKGNVQVNTPDKYTYFDVLRTGSPPELTEEEVAAGRKPETWEVLDKKFNVLSIPKPRDELERMPMWR